MADYTAGIDSFCRYVMRVRYPTEEYLDSIYKFLFQNDPENAGGFVAYIDWLRSNPKDYPYLQSLEDANIPVDARSRFRIMKSINSPGYEEVGEVLLAFLARIQTARSHAEIPAVVTMRRHGYITPLDLDWFFQRVDKTSPFWHTDQWTYWKLYGIDWLIDQMKALVRRGYLSRYDAWFRKDRMYLTRNGNGHVSRASINAPGDLARALMSRNLSGTSRLPQDRRLMSMARIQTILMHYMSGTDNNVMGCATEWMLPGIRPKAICDLAIWQNDDVTDCPSTIVEMETYPISQNARLRQHPYAVYELSARHKKKMAMVIICADHVRKDVETVISQMAHLVGSKGCVEVRICNLSDALSMRFDTCKHTSITLGRKI